METWNCRTKRNSSTSGCRLLQRFEVIEKLGCGAFGVVIKAVGKLDGIPTAIKLVPQQNIYLPPEKLLMEIVNFSKISKHENVVEYVGSWIDELSNNDLTNLKSCIGENKDVTEKLSTSGQQMLKLICIQMELCGSDLRKWLKKRSLVDPKICRTIFHQMLDGLEHIHKQGLIHRDLKPTNIFISMGAYPIIKIGDFGYSVAHEKVDEDYHTQHAGDALYRAPEQNYNKYGKPADLYSLGLILYELYDLSSQFNVAKALTDLKSLGVPKRVQKIYPTETGLIISMIAYKPEDRPSFTRIRTFYQNGQTTPDIDEPMNNLVLDADVYCRSCKLSIYGNLYKCCTCSDVILCETCEGNATIVTRLGNHSPEHPMLKVKSKTPAPNSETKNGCQHYRRRCKIMCPIVGCSKLFWCRICHDDVVKGHQIDRFRVKVISCAECSTLQSPSNRCVNCLIQFGQYYCPVCHLYDNGEDAKRLIWHCERCGICRKKESEETLYQHCENCSMCNPVGPAHDCRANAGKSNCSVCTTEIFGSRIASVLASCGHYVHKTCMDQFPPEQKKCPVCGNW